MTNPSAAEMETGHFGSAIATIPLKRVGHETEIAGPVLFLSSKAGGYADGAVLVVDGGRLMVSLFIFLAGGKEERDALGWSELAADFVLRFFGLVLG